MTSLNPIERCALIDLTELPRVGFRGIDAAAFLNQRGYQLPEAPNRALTQEDGSLVARLSQTEYLLLGSLTDRGERIAAEESGWQLSEQGNYLLPRQDSHAWLQLSGRHVAEVMAKVCGVDLRPDTFPVGAVAQTSAARLNVIVINAGTGELPRFHILCDRASLEYFHGAMLDAMHEFGGQPVGQEALLS
ncbi:TPA: sarcosine oxidase [Pseudomonas aeruginosa]|uniref:sarcosine oxidase subunit gamma n=1 Tax=Pseudomonas TaxID=286 RepID=UPI000CD3CBAD|nr:MULTISPECIES: sarcosine oxidase subunit gamma family protein [Pseudomonas]MBH9518243.1 sarcosine oxidase [Pseudomonas aeruginosa]MBI8577271.1 sarcosine oxidase [Pseudomonas aeruginosa]MBI8804354.1 sarcosine oxidase [Pseudomonas aeruginosa]MCU9208607.1 sarcosine oxidase [Pseudomonas aeruginosa]MDA3374386.1 sarcosine oxidase [Pseudomonas aeruginosa]